VIICIKGQYADKPGPRIIEDRIGSMVRKPSELNADGSPEYSHGYQMFSNIPLGKAVLHSALNSPQGALNRINDDEIKAFQ
jgi:hypothetical protein